MDNLSSFKEQPPQLDWGFFFLIGAGFYSAPSLGRFDWVVLATWILVFLNGWISSRALTLEYRDSFLALDVLGLGLYLLALLWVSGGRSVSDDFGELWVTSALVLALYSLWDVLLVRLVERAADETRARLKRYAILCAFASAAHIGIAAMGELEPSWRRTLSLAACATWLGLLATWHIERLSGVPRVRSSA